MSTKRTRILAAVLTIVMALGLFVPAGAVTFSNVEVEEEAPVLDSPVLEVQEEAAPLAAEMEEQPLAEAEDEPAQLAAAGAITLAGGDLESAYVQWTPGDGVARYDVYVAPKGGSYTKLDDKLVRSYSSYMRADALGLKAGEYTLKVVPDSNEAQAMVTDTLTVKAHERTGYGFVGSTASGAYNDDGTLKSNAVVVYVDNSNFDSVSATIGGVSYTGVQAIVDEGGASKGAPGTPVCIRVLGTIDTTGFPKGSWGSGAEGLQVKAANATKNKNLTIEGVGKDATFNGFGMLIRNCQNVEVRNIGLINFADDGISIDTNNTNLWIHNNDFFYGGPGSDSDQAKGDGALDTKASTNITHSYNHFWDSGKCNLQGMDSEKVGNCITYHHNWFDHSDSRHPRVRTCTVHVYNNYYDGNCEYGIAACKGSSLFAENNYFRNTKMPMIIGQQGHDLKDDGKNYILTGDGGAIIKAYGNIIVGAKKFTSYQEDATEFDAYVATSRDEQIPSSVKPKDNSMTYTNFDTASDFYKYDVESAAQAMVTVTTWAGRVQGGDLQYEFDDAVQDTNKAVIPELKSMLTSYKTSLVKIGGAVGTSGSSHTHTPGAWKVTKTPGCNKDTQELVAGEETQYCTTCGEILGTRVLDGQHSNDGQGKCSVCGKTLENAGGPVVSGNAKTLKASDFKMTPLDSSTSKHADFVPGELEAVADGYFTMDGTVRKRTKNATTEGATAEFFELMQSGSNGFTFTVKSENAPATLVARFSSTGSKNTSALIVLNGEGTKLKAEGESADYITVTGTDKTAKDATYKDLPAGTYTIKSSQDGGCDNTARLYSVTVTEQGGGSSTPSSQPSTTPSTQPSTSPSVQPSTSPSVQPSTSPSVQPTPSAAPVAVTGVTLNTAVLTLRMSGTKNATLTANVVPADAANKAVTWRSSNEGVATVSAAGVVTAVSAGSATITVTTADGGKTATCAVTVKAAQGGSTTGESHVLTADEVVKELNPSHQDGEDYTHGTVGAYTTKDGYFTIYPKVNKSNTYDAIIVKAASKWPDASGNAPTWTDYTPKHAFNNATGGSSSASKDDATGTVTEKLSNVFKFTTNTPATVKVWYTKKATTDADGIALFVDNKTEPAATALVASEAGKGAYAEVEVATAGTYYVGGVLKDGSGGKIVPAKIEVAPKAGGSTGDTEKSVTGVTLDKTTLALHTETAKTATLAATVAPTDADEKTVTWSTSDPAVATVVDGTVTAVGAGKATITVTTADGGFTAKCEVTVTAPTVTPSTQPSSTPSSTPSTQPSGTPVSVTGVTIQNGATASVAMGKTLTLSAEATVTGSGATAADKAVTWSSGKESVATVKDGVVTPVSVGTAEIVATSVKDPTKSAKLTLTVNKGDVTLSIRTRNEGVISDGGTILLEVDGVPAGAQAQVTIAPTTGGAKVEACDENGWNYKATLPANTSDKDDVAYEVTAAFAGNDNWNAAAPVKATVYVRHVGAKVISLTKVPGGGTGKLEFNQGDKMELTVEAKVAPEGTLQYAWSKDGTAIAGATSATYTKENITAADAGVYTCRVSCEGAVQNREVKVTVTVNAKGGVAVESVKLDRTSASIQVKGTLTLTATVLPDNATNKAVNWTSSDSKIATVDQTGKVTGVAKGTATITVTTVDGGKSATCAVTVSASGGGGSTGGGGGGGTGGGGGATGGGGGTGGGATGGGSGSVTSDLPFIDVGPKAWFHDAVKRAYGKGLMKGSDATHFAPNDPTTRAMVATVLFRLDGEKKVSVSQLFADVVSGQWYTDAVAWAADKGIVKGYEDGSFGPNDNVTREQLAAMLYRYAAPETKSDKDLSTFTDVGSISDWATEAITWAVDKGIITGKTGGLLDPQGLASRAEICTMLVRFMDLSK